MEALEDGAGKSRLPRAYLSLIEALGQGTETCDGLLNYMILLQELTLYRGDLAAHLRMLISNSLGPHLRLNTPKAEGIINTVVVSRIPLLSRTGYVFRLADYSLEPHTDPLDVIRSEAIAAIAAFDWRLEAIVQGTRKWRRDEVALTEQLVGQLGEFEETFQGENPVVKHACVFLGHLDLGTLGSVEHAHFWGLGQCAADYILQCGARFYDCAAARPDVEKALRAMMPTHTGLPDANTSFMQAMFLYASTDAEPVRMRVVRAGKHAK